MTDENIMWIGILYILVINIFSFFTMKIDKNRAVKGRWRISEKFLLSLSIVGGSLGMMMGMSQFHHKTKKSLFKIGIPAIIILQILIVSLIIKF